MNSILLAEMMDLSRRLSLSYMDKLKDKDLYREFEIEGVKLNSAFWIYAHLAVTENYLLLRSTGGEPLKITWARQFGLGGSLPAREACPTLEEVKETVNQVHEKSLLHISTLSNEQLLLPNTTGVDFGSGTSMQAIIQHAIRHEGTHAGHLGWLCKLHGIKNI